MNLVRRLSALALLGCAGCVWWVPDHGQNPADRGTVPAAVRASFSPGITTRVDVLCALGEPDWMRADEARFVYRARVSDSHLMVLFIRHEWGTTHWDTFEFDPNGVLVRHRQLARPYSDSGKLVVLASSVIDAEMELLFEERAP